MAKTALDNSKNQMRGKNGEFYSSFTIVTGGNNPKFVVNTNNPAHKNEQNGWGKFSAPTTPVDLSAFLEAVEKVVASDKDLVLTFQLSDQPYMNGVKSKDVMPVMNLSVGKNEKGLAYVEAEDLTDKRFGKHRFFFAPPDRRFVSVRRGATEELPINKINELYAGSWMRFWSNTIYPALVSTYTDSFANRGGNGGGNGGGNRGGYQNNRGNGGGNYSSNRSETPQESNYPDEDIPF